VPQAWQCASSPDRGQYHSKMTPTVGRGEDYHIYTSLMVPQQWAVSRQQV